MADRLMMIWRIITSFVRRVLRTLAWLLGQLGFSGSGQQLGGGEIVIRLHGVDTSLVKTVNGSLVGVDVDINAVRDKLDEFGDFELVQSFPRIANRLVTTAIDAGSKLPSTPLFLRAIPRRRFPKPQLLSELNALPAVEYAVAASRVGPPPATPLLEDDQTYLESSAGFGGCDVRFAWTFPGGDGDDVRICVCDQWVRRSHEEFMAGGASHINLPYALPSETALLLDKYHGTLATGVLAAEKDAEGVSGMNHAGEFYFASIYSNMRDRDGTLVAGLTDGYDATLLFAIDVVLGTSHETIGDVPPVGRPTALPFAPFEAGDVILIESQVEYPTGTFDSDGVEIYDGPVPPEYDPDVRQCLREIIDTYGVVVVEPAGNGNKNLDVIMGMKLDGSGTTTIWGPGSGDESSHAVMVGAGHSGAGLGSQSRIADSNYGIRVDCQGWGDTVATTGFTGSTADTLHSDILDRYYSTFGKTSAASAVIAGVCGCLFGALRAVDRVISVDHLRELLRDDANGRPQPAAEAGQRIGPLPDLWRLLDVVGIPPQIYVRDSLSDDYDPETAITPMYQALQSMSPDIILSHGPIDKVHAMDAGWAEDLSVDFDPAKDHLVYVRVVNRGSDVAKADIYVGWHALSCNAISPEWNHIGGKSVEVDPGQRSLVGPFDWKDGPVGGVHPTVIALILHEGYTILDISLLASNPVAFQAHSSNLRFRNLQAAEARVGDASAPPFTFHLNDTTGGAGPSTLEVLHEMPAGTTLEYSIGGLTWSVDAVAGVEKTIPVIGPPTERLIGGASGRINITGLPATTLPLALAILPKFAGGAPAGEFTMQARHLAGDVRIGQVNYHLAIT